MTIDENAMYPGLATILEKSKMETNIHSTPYLFGNQDNISTNWENELLLGDQDNISTNWENELLLGEQDNISTNWENKLLLGKQDDEWYLHINFDKLDVIEKPRKKNNIYSMIKNKLYKNNNNKVYTSSSRLFGLITRKSELLYKLDNSSLDSERDQAFMLTFDSIANKLAKKSGIIIKLFNGSSPHFRQMIIEKNQFKNDVFCNKDENDHRHDLFSNNH